MKESEFYARSFDDSIFRDEQMIDLRRREKIAGRTFWIGIIIALALSLHGGMVNGAWDSGSWIALAATLALCDYQLSRTKLAALQVLKEKNA